MLHLFFLHFNMHSNKTIYLVTVVNVHLHRCSRQYYARYLPEGPDNIAYVV